MNPQTPKTNETGCSAKPAPLPPIKESPAQNRNENKEYPDDVHRFGEIIAEGFVHTQSATDRYVSFVLREQSLFMHA
jgi:hypothetical protein